MSCASDQEMSSCSGSPVSFTVDSPHSSPLQQVPQLTTNFTGLTCADKNLYNFIANNGKFTSWKGSKPFLQIIEQPQNHFRFRYVSEMIGTHGCILGRSSTSNNKVKTHPTVELVNYTGRALIRCRLAQHNNTDEHPHKLLEDEQDRDVSYVVPEQGIYKVGFPGMGIIHTAKKDVAGLLFKKITEQSSGKYTSAAAQRELKTHCENLAKSMNLNIVRLKFSAHDVDTGREICEPVFSEPIHNMKSAATNDLKICRISMYSGRPRGGEDVFILVEKVNKKNIMIRFFELDENGERIWTGVGTFLQSDVHHQYAIVFRTPQYRDPQTPVDVKVYIELVRPTDGRTSEPKEFIYKADPVNKQNKKRKNTSSYSSLESCSGGSIGNDLPTVLFNNTNDTKDDITEIPAFHIQLPSIPVASTSGECGLGSALGTVLSQQPPSPMWSAPAPVAPLAAPAPAPASVGSLPQLQLDSAELNTMARDVVMDEAPIAANQAYLAEYFNTFSLSLSDMPEMNGMDFIRTTLVADSGRIKVEKPSSPQQAEFNNSDASSKTETNEQANKSPEPDSSAEKTAAGAKSEAATETSDYPAYYTPSEAAEVKKLVRELCGIIRDKKRTPTAADVVRQKLERLFEIRLSNGDTFLHMTLCSNQSSFETIVKMIHGVKMSHLLNIGNSVGETILHLAMVQGSPALVKMLVERGCSVFARTQEEDTCVHYAVRYGGSRMLRALLDAAAPELDALNAEGCTALHLCVLHARATCARLLCERGASLDVRDAAGRTPLHLCALDGRVDVARALLAHAAPEHVEARDATRRSALALVCARRPPDLELARLLLAHRASPPPSMARHPTLAPLLREFISQEEFDALLARLNDDEDAALDADEIKSEPDDVEEYESADEEAESAGGLCGLQAYAREVSRRVEAAGAWRELAHRLGADALLSWFQNQPSPAYTLLNHVKESRDDLTSKSLALILDDMGLTDAANIIRTYIN